MTKQQLATKIWATANELRKNIKASEYKDYILGFMFYKFLCDKEIDYLKERYKESEIKELQNIDEKTQKKFKDYLGYFIEYKNLFCTWKDSGVNLGAKDVSEAIDDFYLNLNDKHKKVFANIFKPLQAGLSKLGEGENAGSRDKAVRDIIDLIDYIPPTSRNYDVLGYIYEYLIQQFSSEAKKDGAFYTPHELTSLMARYVAYRLKDRNEIYCYDPTIGSGGLLLNIGKEVGRYIDKDNIHYYGQELISETANLAKMNLFMQGVPVQNICIRNANTLEDDWPYFDEQTPYNPLFVDATVANPPYSARYEPENLQTDERFKGYGLAPATKADYAFLLHCLYHIKNDGIMAIVLPHGVLFRGGAEEEIRKNLILNHNIETIISFPGQLFFSTGIPVIVVILSKNRTADDILFIDASQSYKKGKKQNVLTESDVQRIFDTMVARKEVPNYAHLASLEEIKANDYNLNVPRYVSAAKKEAGYDLFSVMTGKVSDSELESFDNLWKHFPTLKGKLVHKMDSYNVFVDTNVSDTVFADKDVTAFLNDFNDKSEEFRGYLEECLINHEATPAVYHEITETLFEKYRNNDVVDVYKVFQALAENWEYVDSDLARLNVEGWQICTEIEPNMVSKKDTKTKRIIEEQKGWKGKIFPFDLIKSVYYADDFNKMEQLTNEANAKASEYADIWENLEEDSKSVVCKEDDDTAFDQKKFKSAIKNRLLEDEAIESIRKIQSAIDEEKKLNKEAKTVEKSLDDKAIAKIKSLSEGEVNFLLTKKWIEPIINGIESVGKDVFTQFVSSINLLKKKYSDPLAELSVNLENTAIEFKNCISELVGNDTDMAALKMLLEEL